MARNRILNPEFWLDEEIAKVSPHARLLYMGLWGICDDNYATFPNRPDWIKAQIFPYEFIEIKTFIKELADIGKIVLFEKEGQEFWYIKNFFTYQKVEHPSKPKYPNFKKILTEPSPSPHRALTRNISKVNISNIGDKSPVSPPNEINTLISLFEELNPSFDRLFGNKTERGAVDRLLKLHGEEVVKKRIEDLIYFKSHKFCPVITKPTELENKWAKADAFLKRQQQ